MQVSHSRHVPRTFGSYLKAGIYIASAGYWVIIASALLGGLGTALMAVTNQTPLVIIPYVLLAWPSMLLILLSDMLSLLGFYLLGLVWLLVSVPIMIIDRESGAFRAFTIFLISLVLGLIAMWIISLPGQWSFEQLLRNIYTPWLGEGP